MSKFKLILISILFSLSIFSSKITKRYTINLDLPLEPQYKVIFDDFKDPLKNFFAAMAKMPYGYIRHLIKMISFLQPKRWHDTINLYSKVSGYDVDEFMLANLSYEVSCTSVVIRNATNKVFFGRNLDFEGSVILNKLAYEYEVTRNNTQLYIAAGFIGSVGALNAVVPGKFAVSLNTRKGFQEKIRKIFRFCLGYKNPVFYLQEIVDTADSYEKAVEMMRTSKLTSPVYYTICGVNPNEGAIVSKDYDIEALFDSLSSDQWFMVQTNYDRNQEDASWDTRRVPAENKIKAIGKNITFDNLFTILSQKPNKWLNTIYTSIQSPIDNYLNTTIYS